MQLRGRHVQVIRKRESLPGNVGFGKSDGQLDDCIDALVLKKLVNIFIELLLCGRGVTVVALDGLPPETQELG